jgi:hypothetical protein
MNSLEKLQELLAGTSDIVPEDEEQARLVQMLQMAGPFLGELIPKTAEELDNLLLGLLGWTIQLRSDDADPEPATRALAEAFGLIKERAGLEEREEAPGAEA